MARVITLDAGVLIAMLNERDKHHEWATRLLIDFSDAEFVMPALTYAECLVRPTQAGQVAQFESNISGLALELVELTAERAAGVARIRAETKLRMPDAVVLATALEKSSWVATTDGVLARAAENSGVTVHNPK
jgi:predicted nucleic acid-binding protein